MKTIQMTLDENLVTQVDKMVKKLNTTRSAFTRDALRKAISSINNTILEGQHKEGYRLHPVGETEFSVWEDEQDWGEK